MSLDRFANSFLRPVIEHGEYFEVETSIGTEIVPADAVSRLTETVFVGFLLNYLEGQPLDDCAELERKTGWLARMSAPGYMDATPWSAFESEQEAWDYLTEYYGDDE